MKLYTCRATCQVCGALLNEANHVPESQCVLVTMSAPLVAICEVKDHNTLSDCNIGVNLEWIEEPESIPMERARSDSLDHLTLKRRDV